MELLPSPSVGMISTGIVLWFIGSIAAFLGALNPVYNIFAGTTSISPWVAVGGVVALVGFAVVVVGIYRVASAVDRLYGDLVGRWMDERK